MAVPPLHDFFQPLLKSLEDGAEHRMRDLKVSLPIVMGLTNDDLSEMVDNGRMRKDVHRIGWARTYLHKAGLVTLPRRGVIQITPLGKKALEECKSGVDKKYLMQFESFREFVSPKKHRDRQEPKATEMGEEAIESTTPEEQIEESFGVIINQVSSDLLDTIKSHSPYFFEAVVVKLLRAMGYGGLTGHSLVTPKSGDGGIDGIIYEDKLGLDTVCIQAKRWEGTVGRKTVQEFVGSMDLHRSRKGVILTTSKFSSDALDYVDRIEGKKVVLIDGEELTRLMIDHKVGVTVTKTYELVDVSQDFFDEDA